MCWDKKCCFCIPVEVGSLILGVLSSLINALAILGCIGGLVYVNVFLIPGHDQYSECVGSYCTTFSYKTNQDAAYSVAANGGLAAGLLLCIIEFAFSVALADGASKKKAHHVKAYFIYGVVKTVLALIGNIVLFVLMPPAGLGLLIPLVVYILLLVMVYQTYTKFLHGGYSGVITSYVDRVQLVENRI